MNRDVTAKPITIAMAGIFKHHLKTMLMTWKELKDFCNNVPESFLEEKVIMWREGDCITDISVRALEWDHYIDDDLDEEGCYPEFEAISKVESNTEDYPNGISDLRRCYEKGHPILEENF